MSDRGGARPEDVSVVITVFDNAPTIGEAIESVLSQTWPPAEVVVIDDGSTDASGDVARSFGGAVRVVRQENRGISAGRNRGVREARGSVLSSIDADDRWARDKLERQLPLLTGEVEAVTCSVAQVSEMEWADVVSGARPPSKILRGVVFGTLLIRREAFERIGGFDESYRIAEQIEWSARAVDRGLRLAEVPEPLLYRRLHDQNHGIRQRARRADEYARAVHLVLSRRRSASATASAADADRAAEG